MKTNESYLKEAEHFFALRKTMFFGPGGREGIYPRQKGALNRRTISAQLHPRHQFPNLLRAFEVAAAVRPTRQPAAATKIEFARSFIGRAGSPALPPGGSAGLHARENDAREARYRCAKLSAATGSKHFVQSRCSSKVRDVTKEGAEPSESQVTNHDSLLTARS
jgi:hypothetical protein